MASDKTTPERESDDDEDVRRIPSIRVPLAMESQSPHFANEVRVETPWANETVTLEFFFLSTDLRLRVYKGAKLEGVEVEEDGDVSMRVQPIARVALPASTALQMARDVLTVTETAVDDLAQEREDALKDFAELVREAKLAARAKK